MIQKGLAMKRSKSIKIRKIKYNIYYTIRSIVLLPIRLLLLPFKLLGRAVFYSKPKPNKTVLTIVFNKLRGINERITSLNDIHSHRIDAISNRIDELKKRIIKLEDENKIHINCFNGSESSHLSYRINELELSLENMKPKDLGTFNFINDEHTQIELSQIEAELDGERVAREEYDWHREQKAKDKQIQERMRKDETDWEEYQKDTIENPEPSID